jgi:hypothetical protein
MTPEMSEPQHCMFCGYYLTTLEKYAGSRCVDPAHWQAAGMLAANDFYPMARIAAGAHAELDQRPNNMAPQPYFAE